MEKLKINTAAITVQNETKKHFITGSTLFVELGSVNRTVSRLCLHYHRLIIIFAMY